MKIEQMMVQSVKRGWQEFPAITMPRQWTNGGRGDEMKKTDSSPIKIPSTSGDTVIVDGVEFRVLWSIEKNCGRIYRIKALGGAINFRKKEWADAEAEMYRRADLIKRGKIQQAKMSTDEIAVIFAFKKALEGENLFDVLSFFQDVQKVALSCNMTPRQFIRKAERILKLKPSLEKDHEEALLDHNRWVKKAGKRNVDYVLDDYEKEHPSNLKRILMEDASKKYRRYVFAKKQNAQYGQRISSVVKLLTEYLKTEKKITQVYVDEITKPDIEAWLTSGRTQGKKGTPEAGEDVPWKPYTKMSYLSLLRGFFEWCIKKLYLPKDKNPTQDAEHGDEDQIEKMSIDPEPPGILTVEQVRTIFNHLKKYCPELIPLATELFFQGGRPYEGYRLFFNDYKWNPDNGKGPYREINGYRSKTRTHKTPIHAVTKAWMDPFITTYGAIAFTRNALERLRGEMKKALGVDYLAFDIARHCYATYRAKILDAQGVSHQVLADELGNSVAMIERYYRNRDATYEEAVNYFNIMPPPDYAPKIDFEITRLRQWYIRCVNIMVKVAIRKKEIRLLDDSPEVRRLKMRAIAENVAERFNAMPLPGCFLPLKVRSKFTADVWEAWKNAHRGVKDECDKEDDGDEEE